MLKTTATHIIIVWTGIYYSTFKYLPGIYFFPMHIHIHIYMYLHVFLDIHAKKYLHAYKQFQIGYASAWYLSPSLNCSDKSRNTSVFLKLCFSDCSGKTIKPGFLSSCLCEGLSEGLQEHSPHWQSNKWKGMKWVVREQVQEVSVISPYRVSLDISAFYILSLNMSWTFVEKPM